MSAAASTLLCASAWPRPLRLQREAAGALLCRTRGVPPALRRALERTEIAPGIDLERDVLAHMDFVPLMRDVKVLNAALFQPVWGLLTELVGEAA